MTNIIYNLRERLSNALDPADKLAKQVKGLVASMTDETRLAITIAADTHVRQAALKANFQISNEAQDFILNLDRHSFRVTGTHWLTASCIITLANQDQMIWVQLHMDGKLNRVFQEVNENNLETLANKLLNPPPYIKEAQDKINGALKALILEFGDTQMRMTVPAPEYVDRVETMLRDGERILREVK